MMAIRQLMPLAVITVLVTAACGQTAAAGSGSGAGGTGRIVPFSAFLDSVRSASYSDFAGRPGTRVRDGRAFAQMRSYLLDRYRGAHVVRSYAIGGAVFDCTQQAGAHTHSPAPASAPGQAATSRAPAAPAGCPQGSVPVRRTTLDDLVKFASLREYLGKGPGGPGRVPPAPGSR